MATYKLSSDQFQCLKCLTVALYDAIAHAEENEFHELRNIQARVWMQVAHEHGASYYTIGVPDDKDFWKFEAEPMRHYVHAEVPCAVSPHLKFDA